MKARAFQACSGPPAAQLAPKIQARNRMNVMCRRTSVPAMRPMVSDQDI